MAVIRPDSHGALVVEVAVVWQWLAATDDVTTPWVMPFAVLLFVLPLRCRAHGRHTHCRSRRPALLLLRWLRRCGSVVAATVGVWAIVVVMEQRRAPAAQR